MKIIKGEMTADDLRIALDELGLSQHAFGDMIGARQATISRYVRGDLEIPLMVEKLVQYMLREHRSKNIETSKKKLYVLGDDDIENIIKMIRDYLEKTKS